MRIEFGMVADERRKLADDVEKLSEAQWGTPSSIQGWSCYHVMAHMAWTLDTSLGQFLVQLVKQRGILRMVNHAAASETRPGSELARIYRSHAERRFPPTPNPIFSFVEVVAHGLDIRAPLSLPYKLDDERAKAVLGFMVSDAAVRGFRPGNFHKKFSFEATDVDWKWGQGPVVKGSANALIQGLLGRRTLLGDVSGDGADAFRERVNRVKQI